MSSARGSQRWRPASLSARRRIDRSVALAEIGFLLHQHQVRRHQQRSLDSYVDEPFRGVDWQIQGMTRNRRLKPTAPRRNGRRCSRARARCRPISPPPQQQLLAGVQRAQRARLARAAWTLGCRARARMPSISPRRCRRWQRRHCRPAQPRGAAAASCRRPATRRPPPTSSLHDFVGHQLSSRIRAARGRHGAQGRLPCRSLCVRRSRIRLGAAQQSAPERPPPRSCSRAPGRWCRRPAREMMALARQHRCQPPVAGAAERRRRARCAWCLSSSAERAAHGCGDGGGYRKTGQRLVAYARDHRTVRRARALPAGRHRHPAAAARLDRGRRLLSGAAVQDDRRGALLRNAHR